MSLEQGQGLKRIENHIQKKIQKYSACTAKKHFSYSIKFVSSSRKLFILCYLTSLLQRHTQKKHFFSKQCFHISDTGALTKKLTEWPSLGILQKEFCSSGKVTQIGPYQKSLPNSEIYPHPKEIQSIILPINRNI